MVGPTLPGVPVVTETFGAVPPVRPEPSAVIAATSLPPSPAAKVQTYGPLPEIEISSSAIVASARRAVWTSAPVALYLMLAVCAPPKDSLKFPPVGAPSTVTVWTSLTPTPVPVIAATLSPSYWPPSRKRMLQGPPVAPVTSMSPGPMLESASSAVFTWAAVAVSRFSAAVVCPEKVSVKVVPASPPVSETRWDSSAAWTTPFSTLSTFGRSSVPVPSFFGSGSSGPPTGQPESLPVTWMPERSAIGSYLEARAGASADGDRVETVEVGDGRLFLDDHVGSQEGDVAALAPHRELPVGRTGNPVALGVPGDDAVEVLGVGEDNQVVRHKRDARHRGRVVAGSADEGRDAQREQILCHESGVAGSRLAIGQVFDPARPAVRRHEPAQAARVDVDVRHRVLEREPDFLVHRSAGGETLGIDAVNVGAGLADLEDAVVERDDVVGVFFVADPVQVIEVEGELARHAIDDLGLDRLALEVGVEEVLRDLEREVDGLRVVLDVVRGDAGAVARVRVLVVATDQPGAVAHLGEFAFWLGAGAHQVDRFAEGRDLHDALDKGLVLLRVELAACTRFNRGLLDFGQQFSASHG